MYKCFDEYGREDVLDTCVYILINDYEKLLTDCVKEDIIIDGLEDAYKEAKGKYPFVVKMNQDDCIWEYFSPNDCPTWLSKQIAEENENESTIHKSTNTNTQLYNLYITFKSGVTLLTNTEPVTFEEIAEAIRVLQKPFVFGKQITEFKIEVL